MSETCTFCEAERYTSLWVRTQPTADEVEVPVCIECKSAVEQQEAAV